MDYQISDQQFESADSQLQSPAEALASDVSPADRAMIQQQPSLGIAQEVVDREFGTLELVDSEDPEAAPPYPPLSETAVPSREDLEERAEYRAQNEGEEAPSHEPGEESAPIYPPRRPLEPHSTDFQETSATDGRPDQPETPVTTPARQPAGTSATAGDVQRTGTEAIQRSVPNESEYTTSSESTEEDAKDEGRGANQNRSNGFSGTADGAGAPTGRPPGTRLGDVLIGPDVM